MNHLHSSKESRLMLEPKKTNKKKKLEQSNIKSFIDREMN